MYFASCKLLSFRKLLFTVIACYWRDCIMNVQGCFWGVEHYFNKHFKEGILKSEVGYTGGDTKDPNYRQVRRNRTCIAQFVGSLRNCAGGGCQIYLTFSCLRCTPVKMCNFGVFLAAFLP